MLFTPNFRCDLARQTGHTDLSAVALQGLRRHSSSEHLVARAKLNKLKGVSRRHAHVASSGKYSSSDRVGAIQAHSVDTGIAKLGGIWKYEVLHAIPVRSKFRCGHGVDPPSHWTTRVLITYWSSSIHGTHSRIHERE